MRLISYRLIVPHNVGTVDRYFHLMFKEQLPNIDGKGKITDPSLAGYNLNRLANKLKNLSKAHPVQWRIRVHNRGTYYDFIANGGEASYDRVRIFDDAG